jgi:STE24 endopeptidase
VTIGLRCLWLGLLGCLLVCGSSGLAAQEPGRAVRASAGDAYRLAPDVERKAVAYSRERVALGFAEEFWGIFELLLLLTLGVAYRMRNVAVNLTRKRWGQGAIFLFQLLLVTGLLNLPLALIGHYLAVEYGQSVQGWGSWLGDRAKEFLLSWGIGLVLVMMLFWAIRRFPRRWWIAFWALAMVAVVFGLFVSPYVIDPLFNRFEPLEASNPALVGQLERVVARGGIAIPPDRMFLMKASEKVTRMNAYVTGFGASKRVVVWDTTIAKAPADEILFIFGHEMGHYRLNHIPLGLGFTAVVLFVGFGLGAAAVRWLIGRYGGVWRVSSLGDWGALVVMLLVLSVLGFLSEPLTNGFSRWEEHQADVYGQEAIHGIVADPQTTAVASFQRLGETSLDDPHPDPFVVFWTYSHPSIQSRAGFARDYNPWTQTDRAAGQTPKYFKR